MARPIHTHLLKDASAGAQAWHTCLGTCDIEVSEDFYTMNKLIRMTNSRGVSFLQRLTLERELLIPPHLLDNVWELTWQLAGCPAPPRDNFDADDLVAEARAEMQEEQKRRASA